MSKMTNQEIEALAATFESHDNDGSAYLQVVDFARAILAEAVPKWLPIDSAPEDEKTSFLVVLPRNAQREECVIQVSKFQGDMYPDYLGGLVDFDDRIVSAIGWMPIPAPPVAATTVSREDGNG